MKTHLLRFTLYATFVYLTGFTLNSAVTASQPLEENEGHFCGFDGWQPDNRHYAQTCRKKLRVQFSPNGNQFLTNTQGIEPQISKKERPTHENDTMFHTLITHFCNAHICDK